MKQETVVIYHNTRCSKSRGALELLQAQGVPYEVRLYLKDPLTAAEIKDLLKKLGRKAVDLLRRGEPVFRELDAGRELDEEGWIQAMAAHPVLIERPIVVKGNKAIVARPPEKMLELFR